MGLTETASITSKKVNLALATGKNANLQVLDILEKGRVGAAMQADEATCRGRGLVRNKAGKRGVQEGLVTC